MAKHSSLRVSTSAFMVFACEQDLIIIARKKYLLTHSSLPDKNVIEISNG